MPGVEARSGQRDLAYPIARLKAPLRQARCLEPRLQPGNDVFLPSNTPEGSPPTGTRPQADVHPVFRLLCSLTCASGSVRELSEERRDYYLKSASRRAIMYVIQGAGGDSPLYVGGGEKRA